MINYNPKEWFTFIFRVHKSDTVRQLMPMIVSLSIYVALVAFLEIEVFNLGDNSHLKNITILHGMLGFVISLLLVFRTNTAYERWWEGRKLWGSLTNTSRNLAMKINAVLPKDDVVNRTFFREHIVEYAFALKRHLRGHQRDSEVFQSNVIIDHELHKPNHIAALMYTRLNDLYNQKIISGTQLLFLNEEFRAFTDICGACERIKNTPIPFSYSVFIKKFIFFYVMSLPFGYVFSLGYIAVPIVVFVFYVLASLEIIAEEIENPFGVDDNDLPLTMMSKNIQKHVAEIL
ncbi:bestrophin family protein [Arcicella lustrica]|uniref:Bestrophin family ion channel n=1 Tax=Arcicella lustrica TaxID=2984196 RepID=A0ABU5SN80_9BACT|nr:bestrophin family ion channel [Arcicella sp. DC25W]MEA5428725.1 bestrophin family ion channel [Arcicella sp. DC25W]